MEYKIYYIQSPPFFVDFNEFVDKKIKQESSSLNSKIQKIVSVPFLSLKNLFKAILEGSYITFSNAGISFKHIVLGYYGNLYNFRPPADIYLAVVKVVFWILSMGLCVSMTSLRIFLDKMGVKKSDLNYLNTFTGDEIDSAHIKTEALALDASHVPPEVQVDDLAAIYDAINFEHRKAVGYMAKESRNEVRTNSVEELRESLGVFISKVKRREPFLGTPSSYDTPRLMDFYQQIEDAIRLSIHESNERIKKFKENNGETSSDYLEQARRQYNDLLEDRARIAIDLAIAGQHCGARYMGEAMSVYHSFNPGNVDANLTLDKQLIELLAFKRKEICKQQIQQHLGNDTHSENKYLGNMGKILGIPGSLNIIETLSTNFDRIHYLKLFFEAYSVDSIIEAIQEEIKSKNGQPFREKITDWFKDQLKDWNEENYNTKSGILIAKINEITAEKEVDPSSLKNFNYLEQLLEYLKKKDVVLPNFDDGWDAFVMELFVLDQAKEWRKKVFPDLNLIKVQQQVETIKVSLSERKLEKEMIDKLKKMVLENNGIDHKMLALELDQMSKINQIRRAFNSMSIPPLGNVTIIRMINNIIDPQFVIKDSLDRTRRDEFLSELNLEDMAQNGLSKELIEWLLVYHNILLPQLIK